MPLFQTDLNQLRTQLDKKLLRRSNTFRPPKDPIAFCTEFCFKPTVYQEKLLRDGAQFIAARWSRQSGKSHCVSALILWACLTNPGCSVVVLSPSIRQSKIIIRKLSSFLRAFPRFVAPKPLKTKIEFYNGSLVQAFPNNPETLRGEPGVHFVYIDEFNYVRDDSELYDAAIFTLGTTNGRFLATSTPGSRNSIFYGMCDPSNPAYTNVSRHHVSYKDALEPYGPLKRGILDQIRNQYEKTDPWRWTREMEAEFAEDEDSYLSMSTITGCVDPNLEPITDDFFLVPNATLLQGSFYTGTDLGLKHDYSAVAIVKKAGQEIYLTHLRRFRLGTEFASVLGWIRVLNERGQTVHRNMIDQTGMGEFFVQEAIKSGLKNAEGIMLSLPSKQEVLGYLKQLMEAKRLHIFYDVDLINELHLERYELSKVGQIMFSHPQGTHDDRLWALALAVYASRPDVPKFEPFAALGKRPGYLGGLSPNIPRGILRPGMPGR